MIDPAIIDDETIFAIERTLPVNETKPRGHRAFLDLGRRTAQSTQRGGRNFALEARVIAVRRQSSSLPEDITLNEELNPCTPW